MEDFIRQINTTDIQKIVISSGRKDADYKKICVTVKTNGYQIEKFTDKQVYHENKEKISIEELCSSSLEKGYRQIDIFTSDTQYAVKSSKKGKLLFHQNRLQSQVTSEKHHDHQKNYLLEEGQVIEPLADMGIFTKEGKVVRIMYDKFKQINRFLEIIDDAVRESKLNHYHIIDFGCGKSYLTFIVYYYFTHIKKIPVTIIGLDLKKEVIQKCNEAALRYGYKGLHFELGDINGYQADVPVDMVLTLHACDTATDYALYNAVKWKAKMIFSVPCCQHELNKQIQSDAYSVLTRYGIIKERFSALATDAIRGCLLEYCGYKTQLLEFVDLSHTPKNILIRAVRKPIVTKAVKEKRLAEINHLMEEFHFKPKLYELIMHELPQNIEKD